MSQRLRVVVIVGLVFFLILLGLAGYFSWINIAYVDTLHARVDGVVVQVRAPALGRVAGLPLEVGDVVAENEEMVTLEAVTSATGQLPVARVLVPVRAPLTGVVSAIATRPGDIVVAGQTLITLVDPNQLWVTANIHENRIAQVRVGQTVRIYIRTRTVRRTFWGRVEQIGRTTTAVTSPSGASADISTPRLSEVPIRVSIDPAGYVLYPGMTAEVRVRLDARPKLDLW